jgi:hypothetical protein
MAPQLSDEEIYAQALKRVEEKKGFFVHLTVYVLINTMMILIWAFIARSSHPWFVWTLGGWGIGLVIHFLSVFVFSRRGGWEHREVAREVERIKREQP